jgi:hypothetical protein
VAAVLVHRDADGPDPDAKVATSLEEALRPVDGHAAVAVQEIEAWWLLFPDAVEAVRPVAWKGRLPRSERDVETVERPKELLRRLTGKDRKAEYSEADSALIAKNIREMRPRRFGQSASFDRLAAVSAALPAD